MSDITMKLPEVSSISTVKALVVAKEEAKALKFRPLKADELKLAREWAALLIPVDPTDPNDYISIGKKELEQLVKAAKMVLGKISVEEMKKVREVAKLVLKRVKEVDVAQLSPEAQKKFGFLKETMENIIARISAFFDRYRTVEGELELVAKEIIAMRDYHIELKNDVDAVGKETKQSRHVLRIIAEACKIYLAESGEPYKLTLIEKVNADASEAEKEQRLPDEDLTENLKIHNNYLVIVKNFMATVEGAIIDAYQTYEALEMLENNERIIAQTLDNLVTFTIPAWQRLIVAAFVATQGRDTAEFVQEQYDATSQLRRQTADLLVLSAESIAEVIKSNSFDMPSMEYVNEMLIKALSIISTATEESEQIHEASREGGYRMIAALQKANIAAATA